MNNSSSDDNTGDGSLEIDGVTIANGGHFGHSYRIWRASQLNGDMTRWGAWCAEFPELRKQGIFEHMVSVSWLVDEKSLLMRAAGFELDRELLLRVGRIHDFSEPIRKMDVAATKKKDSDDFKEYLVFEKMFSQYPLWTVYQEAFLLQTCLRNAECFPAEARAIMARLAVEKKLEALFFKGIEMLDYLYSAYEGTVERGVKEMLPCVSARHVSMLDQIAIEFPGFGQVIWTQQVREFIADMAAHYHGQGATGPTKKQLELFEFD
ncbi:MAG: hypothetical protein NT077_04465 [Candidatus Taylorbacteria bacterium]|nr:hypothetical protein [Candidatus Taylorbacteria bacterium]